MSQLTSGELSKEFQKERDATLFAFNESGTDVGNIFRSSPTTEKPYIESFLNETNPKRQKEILRFVPPEVAEALKKVWSKQLSKSTSKEYIDNSSAYIANGAPRIAYDRSSLDPGVVLDDIKLKTVEETGMEVHDFGLGWNEQNYRMMQNTRDINAVQQDMYNENTKVNTPNINGTLIRQNIIEYCNSHNIRSSARVFINNGLDDYNFVDIVIKRDRSRSIINALTNRDKYMG
jgi:hypothetical protein